MSEQPTPRPRRNRRATHPGTSEAARAASEQADERPRRRPAATSGDEPTAGDERERWLLEQRPPHWG
ncbi:hypothetical protein [Janibacter sp. UYMM211]|uniref:hypothetical protein n=1 Tax=Janibacter TaxID=53457 RepID=UPI001785912C|nr:hypothetical protein [Janibacter melonis]